MEQGMDAEELELAGRAVAEQQLRRLNAEGAARGASELEQMVRKWEHEEVAVRKLMEGQQKMFARMTEGAAVGPIVLEPQTPTPTHGQEEPSTPDDTSSSKQAASPGSGLLLNPSLSLIASSPNVRASPAMRKSMDRIMARQAKIWEKVAGTLGTRVSVMLSSPPLKVPSPADANGALRAELAALPPISESAGQLKAIYNSPSPNKRRSNRELSRHKPRTLSSEKTTRDSAPGASTPPPSPVRKLAVELNAQSAQESTPKEESKAFPKAPKQGQGKKMKKHKRKGAAAAAGAAVAAAASAPRADWNARTRPESPQLKLPSLERKVHPSTDIGSQAARAGVGPVRTQSRRPEGADPNLEATQLESKWDEIRNLMDGLQNGWEPGANQGVCLPQLVSKLSKQQVLDEPPRPKKKNKKAAKWRRKAAANRKKQQEAKKARLANQPVW